jgi:hypothetical protein
MVIAVFENHGKNNKIESLGSVPTCPDRLAVTRPGLMGMEVFAHLPLFLTQMGVSENVVYP